MLLLLSYQTVLFFFFFFFQAEDGIRDADVTGVQTCALPISPAASPACRPSPSPPQSSGRNRQHPGSANAEPPDRPAQAYVVTRTRSSNSPIRGQTPDTFAEAKCTGGLTRSLKIPPAGRNKVRVKNIFLAIHQRLTIHPLHLPTSRNKDGVGRCGVPFTGGAHAWVYVGMALGDAAEFQGAAGLHGFVGAEFIDEGAGFVVQVIFAGHYPQGFPGFCHADSVHPAGAVAHVGAFAFDAPEGFFQRRRGDHAHHRHAVFDHGDVHGEFAAALGEVLGAVNRVDQPEPAPAFALFPGNLRAFLRKNRNVPADVAQALIDDLVSRLIRRGNRRIVFLITHLEIGLVDMKHLLTGRIRQPDHIRKYGAVVHDCILPDRFPHVNKLWGSDPQYILRGEMYWGSDPGLKFWRRWGRLLRFQINPQGMCDAPPTKGLSGRDAPACDSAGQ